MKWNKGTVLEKECRLYGMRKAHILSLKTILSSLKTEDPILKNDLERIRKKTEKVEEFFDAVESKHGIEERILLWRCLVGQEDTRSLADESHLCHEAFLAHIEALMEEAESYV